MRLATWIAFSFSFCAALPAQQQLTVPAGLDQAEGDSLHWFAGLGADRRQQTIIRQQHLQPMVGHDLTGLQLRRDGSDVPFAGGTANLTVRLCTTGVDPLSASPVFDGNLQNAVTVFAGVVTFAASAPTAPGVAPWDPAHTVTITFQSPFAYAGGNLVVDVLGLRGTASSFWAVDAAHEAATGTTVPHGSGCGVHSNGAAQWAFVSGQSLMLGATAQMSAVGTMNGMGLCALGTPVAGPGVPLQALLPGGAPNCSVYLNQLLMTMLVPFQYPIGQAGLAVANAQVPNHSSILGAGFAVQWADMNQSFATSNAINCTIAASAPGLGMAQVVGDAASATGSVVVHCAPVLRFQYQ